MSQKKIIKLCRNCENKPIDNENKEEMCKNCFDKWIEFDSIYPIIF